ncbi:MAG TPA: LPXTG cell wall anchor domain-containing protein [Mycobacteriales bacterium]|jgi:LPXTG-motif cell wall-anchored protein|nr:LPXTG cell wall anchor domain-containing protein [Mycobacteriales bacterium]
MSEALSDVMSNIRDHAPSMPSAKDAREAVRSHLPSMKSVDPSVVTDRLPKAGRKRSILAVAVGLLAVAGVVSAMIRRRQSAPSPASLYTPPLPKP